MKTVNNMDLVTLRALAESNDVIISDHDNYRRTPPHYFDSLQNAFGFYFNTFNTQNAGYHFYAEGLSRHSTLATKTEYLDEENTTLCLVSFEHFFELFLKSILRKANDNLAYPREGGATSIKKLLAEINNSTFKPKGLNGKPYTIPFSETLNRFYSLAKLKKLGSNDPIVLAFSNVFQQYQNIDWSTHEPSLRLLNWYRDRILHNGNKLPSLWMLDYFVTQHLVPIILQITNIDKVALGDSLFYFTTSTNKNIIEELNTIRYRFEDLLDPQKIQTVVTTLLRIGHLKELGRANLNMDVFKRQNIQATYEYNYKDPMGRGRRFARVEKEEHEHAVSTTACPCCGVESLVLYRETIDDIFNAGKTKDIEWLKCYTCEYHLRYNVGDPFHFDLTDKQIFS